jgi:hypothetical protein
MARPTRRSGNLPAEASSFVGRRREFAELRRKLTAARLVSLTGPGGVGKSRLALRIATDLARGFPGGAWMVELRTLKVVSVQGFGFPHAAQVIQVTRKTPLPVREGDPRPGRRRRSALTPPPAGCCG